MATTSAASSSDDTSQRDSYIPVLSGQPTEYREWKKRINLYHQKMVLAKRKGESILNIASSLTGSAWRLVEYFDASKAKDDIVPSRTCWNCLINTLNMIAAFNSPLTLMVTSTLVKGLDKPCWVLSQNMMSGTGALRNTMWCFLMPSKVGTCWGRRTWPESNSNWSPCGHHSSRRRRRWSKLSTWSGVGSGLP